MYKVGLREYSRLDYLRHRDERRVKDRNQQIALKREVLGHYGNGKLACVKCGFDDIKALSIDHINGGGSRQSKKTGVNNYAWLKSNDYPLGFRVLCHNCNSALGFYGYCPHQKEKEDELVVD